MFLSLRAPYVLVALFALGAAVLLAINVGAEEEPDGPDDPYAIEVFESAPYVEQERVTEAEAAAAEAALRESGLIERLNGGQAWEVDFYDTSRNGITKTGVYMGISWPEPASTNGPWRFRHCQDTVVVDRTVTIHNLSGIAISLALSDQSILLLTPGAPLGPASVGEPRTQPAFYADPDELAELEPNPSCPDGLEDPH